MNSIQIPQHLTELKEAYQHKIHQLGAEVLPLAPELAHIQAQVAQEEVEMKSKAWRTERLSYIRLTHLQSPSRIQMLNLTIYPHLDYETPIFASDWVILQEKLRVAVIDAMPLFPDDAAYFTNWVTPFAGLYQQGLELAPRYDRKLGWSFRFLSSYATLATGLEVKSMPALYALGLQYLQTYLELSQAASKVKPEKVSQIKAWHLNYNQEHLAVETKRNPLMHYFGEEVGRRYHEEFLFPTHHLH